MRRRHTIAAAILCATTFGGTVLELPDTMLAAQVAVLQHAVARGELLAKDDFAIDPRNPGPARGSLSARDAAGKEAVRDLAEGSPVRPGDVIPPRLVRRGEPVTILIHGAGLSISAEGRALASGGAGDIVRVFSISTNRTLDGIVEGPGTVRIAAR